MSDGMSDSDQFPERPQASEAEIRAARQEALRRHVNAILTPFEMFSTRWKTTTDLIEVGHKGGISLLEVDDLVMCPTPTEIENAMRVRFSLVMTNQEGKMCYNAFSSAEKTYGLIRHHWDNGSEGVIRIGA